MVVVGKTKRGRDILMKRSEWEEKVKADREHQERAKAREERMREEEEENLKRGNPNSLNCCAICLSELENVVEDMKRFEGYDEVSKSYTHMEGEEGEEEVRDLMYQIGTATGF